MSMKEVENENSLKANASRSNVYTIHTTQIKCCCKRILEKPKSRSFNFKNLGLCVVYTLLLMAFAHVAFSLSISFTHILMVMLVYLKLAHRVFLCSFWCNFCLMLDDITFLPFLYLILNRTLNI